jgi:hypothetical protein
MTSKPKSPLERGVPDPPPRRAIGDGVCRDAYCSATSSDSHQLGGVPDYKITIGNILVRGPDSSGSSPAASYTRQTGTAGGHSRLLTQLPSLTQLVCKFILANNMCINKVHKT